MRAMQHSTNGSVTMEPPNPSARLASVVVRNAGVAQDVRGKIAVPVLRGIDLQIRGRRLRGAGGPVRQWQIDLAASARRARCADRGSGVGQWRGPLPPYLKMSWRFCAVRRSGLSSNRIIYCRNLPVWKMR